LTLSNMAASVAPTDDTLATLLNYFSSPTRMSLV
jgi:hypothetical protein